MHSISAHGLEQVQSRRDVNGVENDRTAHERICDKASVIESGDSGSTQTYRQDTRKKHRKNQNPLALKIGAGQSMENFDDPELKAKGSLGSRYFRSSAAPANET